MGTMATWFYSLAIMMIILWSITFFVFNNVAAVHLFLIIALIAGLYGRILEKNNAD
jgi:hypothetical protein